MATLYKTTDEEDDNEPGDRIELIVADDPQELIEVVNSQLARGWRVVYTPITRDGATWIATIKFWRAAETKAKG